jgi:hypothetical protein
MSETLTSVVVFFTNPGTTALANAVGILGFVITLYVAFGVRKIQRQYASRVRLPELRSALQQHASDIGDALGSFSSRQDFILLELNRALPLLEAVHRRLKWGERARVKELLVRVKKTNAMNVTQADARGIFNLLHALIGELEEWERDARWSK